MGTDAAEEQHWKQERLTASELWSWEGRDFLVNSGLKNEPLCSSCLLLPTQVPRLTSASWLLSQCLTTAPWQTPGLPWWSSMRTGAKCARRWPEMSARWRSASSEWTSNRGCSQASLLSLFSTTECLHDVQVEESRQRGEYHDL